MANCKYISLFILLFSTGVIFASKDVSNHVDVPKVKVFEDVVGSFSLREIQFLDEEKWIDFDGDKLNFGFTHSAYWVKVAVSNTKFYDVNKVLRIKYPLLNEVDFYLFEGRNEVKRVVTGGNFVYESREIKTRDFCFDFVLQPNKKYECIIRVRSIGEPLYIPMEVKEYKSFVEESQKEMLYNGFYYGMMFLAFAFNFYFFIVYRRAVYLYNTLFSVTVVMFLLCLEGYAFQYLWSESTWWEQHAVFFIPACSNFLLLLFFTEFFKFKENRLVLFKISRVLAFVIIALAVLSLTSGSLFYIVMILINIVSLFTMSYLIYGSIVELRNKNYLAMYFLVAFVIFVLGVVLYVLRNLAIITDQVYSHNGLKFGFMVEVVFLILAVVHRYRDRERAIKTDLEVQVQERTQELVSRNEKVKIQRDQIAKQHVEVVKQQTSINESIEYAYKLQIAVLPPKSVIDNCFDNYFILNLPRDVVSGDFYWVYETDKYVYFSVTDCTGHGVPGALLSMLGVTALNEAIESKGEITPSSILTYLNNMVSRTLRQQGDNGSAKDGMDLVVCRLDKTTDELMFAGAFNSAFIVRDGTFPEDLYEKEDNMVYYEGDRSLLRVTPDKLFIGHTPQGLVKVRERYRNKRIQLQKGDMVYLTSDGYVDQFGPKGKFKSRRFRKALFDVQHLAVDQKRNTLYDTYLNWKGVSDQIDDILIFGVQI